MKNKSIMSKVITGVMMGSMFISTSTSVFAADATNKPVNPPVIYTLGANNEIKTQLDALVKAGTIPADKGTAIQKAIESNKGDFKTALDSLVKEGTINSIHKTVLEKAITPQDNGKGLDNNSRIKAQLDALVKAGTIPAAKETTIQKAIESNNGNLKAALEALVKAGTITSTQKTAIEVAITPSK